MEQTEFQKAHGEAVKSLRALLAAWPKDVRNYPKYLPSFDEFVADFAEIDDAAALDVGDPGYSSMHRERFE